MVGEQYWRKSNGWESIPEALPFCQFLDITLSWKNSMIEKTLKNQKHYLKIQTKHTVHHVLNTLTTQQPDPVQQVSTGALSKSLFSLDSIEMYLKGLTSLKNT